MPKTILLVDDSPTIRKIVELTFSDSGIRVESVDDPASALERLDRIRADLLLADVALSGPNGYELCRAVKNSDRPVPVLLLAGTFEPIDARLADEAGADGHLTKPFESSHLLRRVETLLEPPPPAAPPDPVEAAETSEADATNRAPEPAVPPRVTSQVDPPGPRAETASSEPGEHADGPSAELVDAVARAVVTKLSEGVLREIAWQVVPELARTMIRERIQEIERED